MHPRQFTGTKFDITGTVLLIKINPKITIFKPFAF